MDVDSEEHDYRNPVIVARKGGYIIARFDAMGLYADEGVVDDRLRRVFQRCRIGIDPGKEPTLIAFHGDRPDDDRVVGGVMAHSEEADHGGEDVLEYSFDVCVLPEHQKGIGFDLLRAAVAAAPQHVALPCRVNLWVVNKNVEPILEWLGFEETARHDGGSCHMEKWLPALAQEISVKVPPVVYHVAPRPRREIIEREGLVPGTGLEGHLAGVYAWRDAEAARQCCGEYALLRGTQHDVWSIVTAHLPWQDDSQAVGSVVTPLPVPSSRLTRTVVDMEITSDPYFPDPEMPEGGPRL